MSRKLQTMFVYGTLRNAAVRALVLGRPDPVPALPVVLRQHTVMQAVDKEYPVLRVVDDGEVEGVLVRGLTPNDLARLDSWEDDEYGLAMMVVHDADGFPHDAMVYVTSVHESTGLPWSFANFEKGVDAYLDEVRAWMVDWPEPEPPADFIECSQCLCRIAVVDGLAVEPMWVRVGGLTLTVLCGGCVEKDDDA